MEFDEEDAVVLNEAQEGHVEKIMEEYFTVSQNG